MNKKIYNLSEYAHYLGINDLKNDDMHIVFFGDQNENASPESNPVTIDFYLIAINPPLDKKQPFYKHWIDQTNSSHLYVDCPQNTVKWKITRPMSGYAIMVSSNYLEKYVKDYNFVHYNNHEALILTSQEENLLLDLFEKAKNEFEKTDYSRMIVISYLNLILTSVKNFYERQFETRSDIYETTIADFRKNLEDFYHLNKSVPGIPSVAYFAQKSNLSPNYFGDLIRHFTGTTPIDHIHEEIIQIAKKKLQNTKLSISEIGYSLGFDYPTSFARFFRQKTGISPKVFRNQ
ncbi:MAG: helix-turn-helix domain-containing protein [Candidatus Chryseobacterium colombiense]|nr:helix-turn-helix domain-containing protein [Chryseobacterium sp.]WEK71187.1 MAG: helix-turn-helix domain-containing protein [Chryseobacterium sp.]